MCLSGKGEFSKTEVSRLGISIRISVVDATAKRNFILATIIHAEVAKTKTSFLAFRAINTWKYNVFLVKVVASHLAYVFLA